jgi:hypothetical protein
MTPSGNPFDGTKVKAADFRGMAVDIREGALSITSDNIKSKLLQVAQAYDHAAVGIEQAVVFASGRRADVQREGDQHRPGTAKPRADFFHARNDIADKSLNEAKVRAADYRMRAEEARMRAASIRWADVRSSLLEVADTYDDLADTIEDIAEKQAQPDPFDKPRP